MEKDSFQRRKDLFLIGLCGGGALLLLLFFSLRPYFVGPPEEDSAIPEDQHPIVVDPARHNSSLEEEIAHLEGLQAQAPDESKIRVRFELAKGETYVKYGRIPEAIACFEIVLKHWPTEKRSHFYLGQLHRAAGNRMEAVRYWTRFLELDPTSYKREEIELYLKAG